VFFGSGLLFLALRSLTATLRGVFVPACEAEHQVLTEAGAFAGAPIPIIVMIYIFRIARLFMLTTSTIAVKTGIGARCIANLDSH